MLTTDTLSRIYKAEGWRGLYRGSLLALVGVSNGSIQFAAYEDIKRRRIDVKKKKFAKAGRPWKLDDEKLVKTIHSVPADDRATPSTFSPRVLPNSSLLH